MWEARIEREKRRREGVVWKVRAREKLSAGVIEIDLPLASYESRPGILAFIPASLRF